MHGSVLDSMEFSPARAGSDLLSTADAEYFRQLYEEHFPFVWRSLRALGVRETELDDAAQEVFLVVHRRARDFTGRSKVRTWLFGIAHGVSRNYRRHYRRKTDALEDFPLEEPMTETVGPHENAQVAEAARFVSRFLQGLDEDKRAVFAACVIQGLTAVEASAALGVGLNTVYSRLRAARHLFREAVEVALRSAR